MRIVTRLAATLVSAASLAGTTWGASISVEHNLSGSVGARGLDGRPMIRNFGANQVRKINLEPGDHDTDTQLSASPGDFMSIDGAEADGQITSFAFGEVGKVGVSLSAIASASNPVRLPNSATGPAGSAMINTSRVRAGWTDVVTLAADDLQISRSYSRAYFEYTGE